MTPYDINFQCCGFPVRIHPLFWVVAVLLGLNRQIDNMPVWFLELAIWVAAVFVSILLHELGHAAAFRYLLRTPSYIVLSFGGATVPLYPVHQRGSVKRSFQNIFVAFAGPFAGFVLAALILLFLQASGISFDDIADAAVWHPKRIVLTLFWDLFWISAIWGIFNLFPIYPLDGGHIAREICCLLFSYNGIRYSLAFSMSAAILLALVSLRYELLYTAVLMGYFAYMNYAELSNRR